MSPAEGLPDELNPAINPLIRVEPPEVDLDKVSLSDDHHLAPMVEIAPDPGALTEALEAAFPAGGGDLVRINQDLTLVRNAAHGFTSDRGLQVQDLPIEALRLISNFLQERRG